VARALHVLVVQLRGGDLAGQWALPGGRVHADATLDDAARDQLRQGTGLRNVYLEQLYTFGSPERDPHGRVISVAYVGLTAHHGPLPVGNAAAKYAAVAWRPVEHLPPLAYDHRGIVRTAIARLRAKLGYTNLAYTLLPGAFTLGELQETYEAILGRTLDRRNFRKKILSLGLVRRLATMRRGPHRPAGLWAFRHRRPMVVEIL
jgi:8-oxo-dGTP diphosphatase